MTSRLLALICAAAVLATAPAVAGESEPSPFSPLLAISVKSGSVANVAWVPGEEPDFFKIYGVTEGGRSLLATAVGSDFSAEVPASFTSYAVSAVKDGQESPAVVTLGGTLPCVTVFPTVPPDVWIGCLPGRVEIKVMSS